MDPDNEELVNLLGDIATMPGSSDETADLIEELQRAIKEHHKILQRQGVLIGRLRDELKDVKRGDRNE